jgi:Spy/CpxP family protein refolding chaperone
MKKRLVLVGAVAIIAAMSLYGIALSQDGKQDSAAQNRGQRDIARQGRGPGMSGGMGMKQCPGMGMAFGFLMKIGKAIENPKIIEKLGLSDVQVSKIKKLQSDTMKSQIKDESDLKIMNIDLRDLLEQDNPDTSKVDAKIDEIGKKQTEMQKKMFHSLLDMKGVLSKEQVTKLKNLGAERMKDGSGKREKAGSGKMGAGMHPGMMGGSGSDEAPAEGE